MTFSLTATNRKEQGTRACKKLRASGSVPAVIYGGAEKEATKITLNARAFEKMWREAGESSVIEIEGLDEAKSVLIHDVSVEPLHGTPLHVDLLAVRTNVAVEVAVALSFEGVAPAEKELGGTLIKVMHELLISALPRDLPQQIDVDIATLATFGDQILVKDITLPNGVTALAEEDEVVALVQEVKEEEEEPVAEVDVADIEVEKKGKEEEPAPSE